MIQATLCFVFRDIPEPSILLGYKKRGFGQGKYDGFGGKLLKGETLPSAAARELQEESSLTADPLNLLSLGRITFIFPYKSNWDQEVYLFVAQTWHGVPTESEEMRPEWFAIGSLPLQDMWDDTHYWIQYVLTRQPIQASFIFDQDNETVEKYSIQLL